MSTIGQAIRQVRERKGLTLNQLADKLGWSYSALQKRESGMIRVKPPERKLIADVLGLSLAEFDETWRAARIEQTRGGDGIPVINRAPAGSVIDYEEFGVDSGQGYEYIDYGGLPHNEHLFAVVVVGDSMEHAVYDGDQLIFRPLDRERPASIGQGRVCFVRFAEEYHERGCTIARITQLDNGDLLLVKDNPAYRSRVVDRSMITQLAVAVERRTNKL